MRNTPYQVFEPISPTVFGEIDKLKQPAAQVSRRWIKGMGCALNYSNIKGLT